MDIDNMTTEELRAAMRVAVATVSDLMESHGELTKGAGNIVCNWGLMNRCRLQGTDFLQKYADTEVSHDSA